VRVLGQFPNADANCVLSSEVLEKIAGKQQQLYKATKFSSDRQFGIDLARFGGDESTIYRRSGEAIVQWARMSRTDPSLVVDQAFKWQLEAGWKNDGCWYVPDAGGIGQGIMHRFYEADKQVLEFHNGGRAVRGDLYGDKVSEAWFGFAKKANKGLCYIPNDNVLIQQLCGRRYYMNRKSKIVLETKDEYMKRGSDSPDRADGCVMAFYDQVEEAAGAVSGGRHQRHQVGVTTR